MMNTVEKLLELNRISLGFSGSTPHIMCCEAASWRLSKSCAIHFHRQTEGARCVLVEDGGESTLPRLDLFFVSRYSSYFLQIFLVTFLANIHRSMFGLVW